MIFLTACNPKITRKIKSSFKDLVHLLPWESLSRYWKEEILAKFCYVWRKEGQVKALCGILMDPEDFLPKYVRRMLARHDMEGCLPDPGYYQIVFKVHIKSFS